MVGKNINHFGMFHIKKIGIFERNFLTEYIDVEFYKLLCSLGGNVLESYYSKDVLENFKSKYAVNNIDEFIQLFSSNISDKNINDIRTVLFYILSINTDNIFRENYKINYLIDERKASVLDVNAGKVLDKKSIDIFYEALLVELEKEFNYQTAAMVLQCPYIFFDNISKYVKGANLFKALLEHIKSSVMAFEEFIYSCYSCIEYINYVYEKTNIEGPEIKDSFKTIKEKAFEVIRDLIGTVDIELYKKKNPLVYFMVISLIEKIGEISPNSKNYEIVNKMLALRTIDVKSKEAKNSFNALNISEEVVKHVKFLYISVNECQVEYVEYMSLKEEIEYLYGMCSEELVNASEEIISSHEEVSEVEVIENSSTVSQNESCCEKCEEITVEEKTIEENNALENYKEESVENIVEENTTDMSQNSLYDVLLAMQKAKEITNVSLDNCNSDTDSEESAESCVDECSNNSFTFTWI